MDGAFFVPDMNTKPLDTTLWQDLRALPGEYWILFSGTLVNRFGHFVIPFLAIYLRQQGHDVRTTGLTLGAYGAGALVSGVIGGYLADRIGRKATMLVSCGGAAVFMMMLSQAHGVPALVVTTFMTGLLTAMYGPAAGALIADLVPPELRVRAFSCLGLTVLVGLKRRPVLARENNGWGHALRHMRGNVPFQLAVGASFLIATVFWQMSSSYGLQATEGAGLDERAYGLLMALNGVLIVFLELPLTSYTKRISPVLAMAAGYAVIGIGMGLNAFGATLPLLVVSMVVFTAGEKVALPVNSGYMAALAPDEMRGRYQGVISISWSVATMVGPAFGIALYQYSPPLLWVATLVMSLAAAGLMLASWPGLRRRGAL